MFFISHAVLRAVAVSVPSIYLIAMDQPLFKITGPFQSCTAADGPLS